VHSLEPQSIRGKVQALAQIDLWHNSTVQEVEAAEGVVRHNEIAAGSTKLTPHVPSYETAFHPLATGPKDPHLASIEEQSSSMRSDRA
jgi:hypothetical protein